MILDATLLFDSAASLAIAPGTQASTNVVDLLNARDMGVGNAAGATPKLMLLVTTAFTTTNAATLSVAFQGSTDNITYNTYANSDLLVAATDLVVQGQFFRISLPRPDGVNPLPRYLRLLYTVATGTFSAGAITAAIVLERGDTVYYAPGIAVAN